MISETNHTSTQVHSSISSHTTTTPHTLNNPWSPTTLLSPATPGSRNMELYNACIRKMIKKKMIGVRRTFPRVTVSVPCHCISSVSRKRVINTWRVKWNFRQEYGSCQREFFLVCYDWIARSFHTCSERYINASGHVEWPSKPISSRTGPTTSLLVSLTIIPILLSITVLSWTVWQAPSQEKSYKEGGRDNLY